MSASLLRSISYAMVFCICSKFADAGVLSYTAGTGGTFDPTTPSTFTFTQFGPGALSPGVSYVKGRLFARWGGTGPLPAGGITATAISATNPSFSIGSITIPGGAAAGDEFNSGSYVSFSPSTVNTTTVDAINLQLTIPTLTVPDGFYLEFALQLSNIGESNLNLSAYQRATAFTSTAVPEPGSWALGCIASLAAVFAWRRRQAPATV